MMSRDIDDIYFAPYCSEFYYSQHYDLSYTGYVGGFQGSNVWLTGEDLYISWFPCAESFFDSWIPYWPDHPNWNGLTNVDEEIYDTISEHINEGIDKLKTSSINILSIIVLVWFILNS